MPTYQHLLRLANFITAPLPTAGQPHIIQSVLNHLPTPQATPITDLPAAILSFNLQQVRPSAAQASISSLAGASPASTPQPLGAFPSNTVPSPPRQRRRLDLSFTLASASHPTQGPNYHIALTSLLSSGQASTSTIPQPPSPGSPAPITPPNADSNHSRPMLTTGLSAASPPLAHSPTLPSVQHPPPPAHY